VDRAILVNAEFLNLIVANPEIFGHDLDPPEDIDGRDKVLEASYGHAHGLYMHEQECDLCLISGMQVTFILILIITPVIAIATRTEMPIQIPELQLGVKESINQRTSIWTS
jgi:hypothetical protein